MKIKVLDIQAMSEQGRLYTLIIEIRRNWWERLLGGLGHQMIPATMSLGHMGTSHHLIVGAVPFSVTQTDKIVADSFIRANELIAEAKAQQAAAPCSHVNPGKSVPTPRMEGSIGS